MDSSFRWRGSGVYLKVDGGRVENLWATNEWVSAGVELAAGRHEVLWGAGAFAAELDSVAVTAVGEISLAEALDAPDLNWRPLLPGGTRFGRVRIDFDGEPCPGCDVQSSGGWGG